MAWTIRLARGVVSGNTPFRGAAVLELLVILAVAAVSMLTNIVVAVFAGVAMAIVMFAVSMSRSIVRRAYRCDAVRSRKARTTHERSALQSTANTVVVMELQGALFFGTSERLANEIDESALDPTRFVILDFRRISEIDSTGARTLLDIDARLASAGAQLLLSVSPGSRTLSRLGDFGVVEAVTASRLFSDLDRAIEYAEDALLNSLPVAPPSSNLPFQASLFENFSRDDIEFVLPVLIPVSFGRGASAMQPGGRRQCACVVVGWSYSTGNASFNSSSSSTFRLSSSSGSTGSRFTRNDRANLHSPHGRLVVKQLGCARSLPRGTSRPVRSFMR